MTSMDEPGNRSNEPLAETDQSAPKPHRAAANATSRGSVSAPRSRARDHAPLERDSSDGARAVPPPGQTGSAPQTEARPSGTAVTPELSTASTAGPSKPEPSTPEPRAAEPTSTAGPSTPEPSTPEPRAAEPTSTADPGTARPGPDQPGTSRPIGPRAAQFMLASRQTPGLQPLSADFVAQQLRDAPGIEIVKTINPPSFFGLQSSAEGGTLGSLVVARMSYDKARLLQSQAGTRLTVEHDLPVTFGLDPGPVDFALLNPGVLVPLADGFETVVEVRGPGGPLQGAEVYVFGSMLPAQGVTDAAGRATISVKGESPETIRALYVKPKADYWDLWLPNPALTPGVVNTIVAKPLGAFLKEFPDRQLLGWGQRAMGLDRVPQNFDGAGVKIAIIDSGAAQPTHRNLHRLGPGVSVVGDDRTAWTTDTVGHGSHCAGVIGGGPVGAGAGVRGFAPAAEIHICRVFPGARFSDLVAALDYCMENGIDVVNMSLGGGEPSQIVEERLIKAKEMGVACIIAAGNSGGPVQFPASSRHALAVSAIGKRGEFPDDSFHATQALQGFESREGYFPAKFSCFGPEVDVCAPGVAIVSSLPPDNFAAWDGTSMAAPHITGLAALVLAHHRDFKGPFQARDARRVERLFQIIKESATMLPIGDASRIGAGLPDAPRALGLEAGTGARPLSEAPPAGDASMQALKKLLDLLAGANGSFHPAASAPSQKEPFRNVEVDRGPARTAADVNVAPASAGFGPGVGFGNPGSQTLSELRDVLRRSGVL
jgi:hypothetical protein